MIDTATLGVQPHGAAPILIYEYRNLTPGLPATVLVCVRVCVCAHARLCACALVCICARVYLHACLHAHACLRAHVRACVQEGVHVWM